MSRESRRERLRELMERLGVGALLLRMPANFAWYTNGADNRVNHSAPLGVASLLVTGDAEYVVADNIEADRMREEEYGGLEVVEHPWHEAPTPQPPGRVAPNRPFGDASQPATRPGLRTRERSPHLHE